MRLPGVLFGALLLLGLGLQPACAEKRVALVIGNSAYRNVTPLDNPENDAKLLADTLRGLGFTLVGGGAQLNLDKPSLDRAVQTFGAQLSGADVGLFYYAGHGLQVGGKNYLVPVDANPTREVDVDFQMLDTTLILHQMEAAGTRLNIVILDACRNNPFGGRSLAVGRARDADNERMRTASSGLAEMPVPEGTLISFATQPGSVAQDGTGGNSPYAKALADTIRKPGLSILDTFNQVGLEVSRVTRGAQRPWVSISQIAISFYFSAPPPMVAADRCVAAEVHWKSAEAIGTQAAFEDHLARFPSCVFSGLAKARLDALKQRAAAASPAMPAVGTAASFHEMLLARLAAASVAPAERELAVRLYEAAPGHKTMSLSPEARHTFRTVSWPSPALAEISGLEACQLRYDYPCALVAVDDQLALTSEVRDMPRLHYADSFVPEQIPRVRSEVLRSSDVVNYRSAAGPKAAALHATGILTVVTGVATALEAQERALAECNNDPAVRSDGVDPCYLYAIDNQVVLPRRLVVPLPLHERLVASFAAAAINLGEREARARDYEAAADHKAIAISFEGRHTFRTGAWPSAAEAEVSALEGCQLRYGSACVLGAVDGQVAPAGGKPPSRRDMPRLYYAGEFATDQIPRIRPDVRQRSDVVNYRSAAGPKAAAIHPVGVFVVITGAADQTGAEERALAGCNNDPDPNRATDVSPCYLYASGNQVVLSRRLTKPMPRQ